MKCINCNFNYKHAEVIQPLITNKGMINVCAICALEISNDIHGISRTHFQGEQAERLLKIARKEQDHG